MAFVEGTSDTSSFGIWDLNRSLEFSEGKWDLPEIHFGGRLGALNKVREGISPNRRLINLVEVSIANNRHVWHV